MAKDEKTGTKRSRRVRGRDKAKPPTKIVMRHLPPTMTEEEFLKQIDPLPDHDFYYFAEADWSLGFDATCRAYITFKNYDDVFLFRDRFDGYVFVDNKGNEYAAIVEFAPLQGFIKNKSRGSDNLVNTIEQESHYQQFINKLEEEREAAAKGGETKLEFSLESKKEEITSTPLLQYLATKKEKRREDAKKRTAEKKRRREEEKEKRKENQPTPQPIKLLRSETIHQEVEKPEQKTNQTREEPKNARARRREERNRLRHEAYLQKKKAFDEQNNQGKNKEEDNKKDKANDSETKSSSDTSKSKVILKKTAADDLTESVRNFIYIAASILPTSANEGKTEDVYRTETENKTKSTEELNKIQNKLSKIDIHKAEQYSEDEKKPAKDTKEQGKREKLTQKQIDEKREERRIRNKDRPSIAIYQPKARFRVSEESDSNSASKDIVRSQSTSDCEAGKKDEQPRHKKVQRYSERSKNRKTSKETSKEDEPQTTENVAELCTTN
ncbi:regulator of nonsense transcripts 3B [Calliphora vicina]|uniref:regulator of nonsense transcripts 3B n=1 Tax=Calliphora vicina TaxID=7373 RepID=UPI00325BAD9B